MDAISVALGMIIGAGEVAVLGVIEKLEHDLRPVNAILWGDEDSALRLHNGLVVNRGITEEEALWLADDINQNGFGFERLTMLALSNKRKVIDW